MTPRQIIKKVKDLNLPKGKYIVFGSVPMCMRGIRNCEDIDLLVSPRIYANLKKQGWDEKITDFGHVLKRGLFDVAEDWGFGSFNPKLSDLLARADHFDGISFASLEDVVVWKKAFGREKDHVDIKLIEDYLRLKSSSV